MKRINFILLTAIFILSGLNSQGQTALNFNRSMQYQPAYKGTAFTGFERNTFDNRVNSLQGASIIADICAGNCPGQITVNTLKGTILCNYWKDSKTTEVKEGEEKWGEYGAFGPWGECIGIVRARCQTKNGTRTDIFQDKHECIYLPSALGMIGTVTQTHLHGAPYKKVQNLEPEENCEYEPCFSLAFSTIPELNNAVATVTSGKELVVNYTGKKATVVVGSPFRIIGDQNLPSQIASIKYNIDGLDVTTGQSLLMNNVGEHILIAEVYTKSGGIVKFNVPFYVIKPVTVEEITQKALNNGETQFDIKIVNNNNAHSSVALISTSMLNKPGYVVVIQGPKQYNLAEGGSTLINILLRPTDIRYVDPARPEAPVSFDFIVSSPAGKGLIIDRKTVSAQPAAITTPSGIVGNDGPQKIRTISVSTLSGEVIDVKVPNIIRPGDHISGSIFTKTQSSTLQGAVVDVQGNKTNVKDKLFRVFLPAGLPAGSILVTVIPLIIRDNAGVELGRTEIPVNLPNLPTPGNNVTVPANQIEMPPQHLPGSFAPMNYCQPGQPLTINGFFDGNAANTTVSINNIPCEIIAESNTGTFAQISDNLPAGKASLTIQEGGVTETISIQVIRTNLTSNKTVVQKNTKAKVTATVSGLENLDLNNNNFKIELTNGSPGIIKFNEANTTTITRDINSSNVKNGTFTFTTDITGSATGAYTITSNISSTTCTDCWDQYKTCIAKVEADEKQCYKDCDNNNGGISCYLACSAAARLKEAECFAQYLGCIRKKLGY